MISLKLITAKVNLGLSIAFAIYMRVCVPVRVRAWFVKCNAFSHCTVAVPYSAIPSYSDALSNGRNKGRNRGGPEKAASGVYELAQSVSTSLLAREIARGRTNCSCRCCNY